MFVPDSLDGSPATRTHRLTLDGVSVRLFLSEEHSALLTATLDPFMAAGQSVNQARQPARTEAGAASAIRTWAREQGFDLGDHGRIPAPLLTAFAVHHARADTATGLGRNG